MLFLSQLEIFVSNPIHAASPQNSDKEFVVVIEGRLEMVHNRDAV